MMSILFMFLWNPYNHSYFIFLVKRPPIYSQLLFIVFLCVGGAGEQLWSGPERCHKWWAADSDREDRCHGSGHSVSANQVYAGKLVIWLLWDHQPVCELVQGGAKRRQVDLDSERFQFSLPGSQVGSDAHPSQITLLSPTLYCGSN